MAHQQRHAMSDWSIEPSVEAYSKSPRQTENERITSERQVSTRSGPWLPGEADAQRLVKGRALARPSERSERFEPSL